MLQSETYLDNDINGKKVSCLIDTGCEQSCLPLKYVSRVTLCDTDIQLKAANGTPINVIGATKLCFKANNVYLYEDFLVSDEVEEILLSFHWLKRNKCQWLFDKAVLVINCVHIPLKQRPSCSMVPETISVPSDTQANVPVRLPWANLHSPACDWFTEARQVKPGLFVPRTLLPNSDRYAAVRFMNVSGTNHMLYRGLPGIACGRR